MQASEELNRRLEPGEGERGGSPRGSSKVEEIALRPRPGFIFFYAPGPLVALGHTLHVHHGRAEQWLQSVTATAEVLGTCAITELGFVRAAA